MSQKQKTEKKKKRLKQQTGCWDLRWDLIGAVFPGAGRHQVVLGPVDEAVVCGYGIRDGPGGTVVPGGLYPVAFVLLNL